MRDLFTIVAMLIVAVLCAALLVPYFLDWEAHRGEVETALEKALGMPVHTQGAIDVRLLPTPHLAIEQIAIGPDRPFLTAQGLNVSIEVPPLLSGQIRVIRAQLVRPVMLIEVKEDGALHLPSLSLATAGEAVGINNLQIEEGTIRFTPAAGAGSEERVIGPVNFTASAAKLVGPWRVDGDVAGLSVHLATGVPDQQNRIRLKLRMQPQEGDASSVAYSEFDGSMQLEPMPSVQGRLTAAYPLPQGLVSLPASEKPEPAMAVITTDIQSEGWHVIGKKIELRIGEGVRALQLTGTGGVQVGSEPHLEMKLSGRRLDLAPFLQSWQMKTDDIDHALVTILQKLPIDIDLNIGSMAVGGDEFGHFVAELRTRAGENGPQIDVSRFSLAFSGGSVQGQGAVSLLPHPSLAGFMQLTGADAPRLADALSGIGIPPEITKPLRQANNIQAAGNIEISQEGGAIRELRLASGDTSINGALYYARGGSRQRGRLEAQLMADRLDMVSLPTLDVEWFARSDMDFDIALEARNLLFGNSAGLSDRHLSARFTTSPEAIRIEHFEMVDRDKAHLQASGQLDENGGHIAVSLKAENAEAIQALSRTLLMPEWAVRLARIKPEMGPFALEATVERPNAGGALIALAKGNIAQANVDARLMHDPSAPANERAQIDITMEHPQPFRLLESLGVLKEASSRENTEVPVRLALTAKGRGFDNIAGKADAAWAKNHLTLVGQWNGNTLTGKTSFLRQSEGADTAHVDARIQWNAESIQLKDLQGSIAGEAVKGALSFKDGAIIGKIVVPRIDLSDIAGLFLGREVFPQPGQKWASARFGEALFLLPMSLQFTTEKLGITDTIALEEGSLQLDLSPETASLHNITGKFTQEGRATGDIVLHRWGTQASLRVNAALDGVSIADLTGKQVSGKLGGKLDLGTTAENVAGLIANLAGGGELQISRTAIQQMDPDALGRLLPDLLQKDVILTDAATVARRLETALDENAWPIADIAVPLTVTGGIVRYGPLSLEAEQARAVLSGIFDISRLYFDVRAHLTARTLPEGWNGVPPQTIVTWRGPMDAIVRGVDAGSTVNGLMSVSLTRELDRIERLEAEARQRVEKARAKREQEQLEQQKKEAARFKEKAEKRARAVQDSAAQFSAPQTGSPDISAPEAVVPPLDLQPGALYP